MDELIPLTSIVQEKIVELERILILYSALDSNPQALKEMEDIITINKANSDLKRYKSKLKKIIEIDKIKSNQSYMLKTIQAKYLIALLAEYEFLTNICKEILKSQ